MNNEENNEKEMREAERIRWELSDIRDELMDELDDLHDDFVDDIEDLLEESEEIKEELEDELEDLEEERESLLSEIGDVRAGLENLGENARERIEYARAKLETLKADVYRHEAKLREKIRKKLEKAQKKAVKRINISVDPEMSDEWKGWAENLGASVSELVRKSMKFVKNNIGDIAKLEALGKKMEKMGVGIEKAVKESGIENLGEKIAAQFEKEHIKPRIKVHGLDEIEKNRVKKRIQGLIKLQKSIPIEKLSQTLNISKEEAENLIYELAAEGIGGDLEEGVFKFSGDPDVVLSKLFELIDKM
jgi:DNA repair exonuclease SbcCD ATPase subunit